MDAFGVIRRSAAELHDQAVTLGADPCSPEAIARKAAEHLSISVIELPANSPLLEGALALYNAQANHIVCVDEGSETNKALLVAHEIGHVRLHAVESRCVASDIDESASIEPTPVGLERVTDYGARERRELHANVFARELMLPMSLVRRLFLKERLGAQAIAERTGLDLSLVRQQVLDAVLMPAAPEAIKEIHVEPDLDPSQEAAAHHSDSAYNLQAGPGTGKTRTLVERVRWLIEQGVDPTNILVLTYSNRAAGELSERFTAALPEAATRIWTGTFHAFGLDLIRRFSERFERTNNPRLFDQSDAIAALEDLLPTLPLKHYRYLWNPTFPLREILKSISRAKDEVVGSARYCELAEATRAKATTAKEIEVGEKCIEVARVYDLYEAILQEQDAVDFGDLVMRPAMLLESDAALRAQLSDHHKHVLVDEFQDSNRASSRLLKAISGDGARLWVVGDARQSIYRFRGASPANLQSFKQDFGGEVGALDVNYRSTEQVVDAVCSVATKLKASDGQIPLELEAYRGRGPGSPEVRAYSGPDEEAAGIIDNILELQEQGVSLRDQAILCRSHTRLAAVAKALEARGVPVLHLGSFFERDDVRDFLALMSLLVDRFGAGLVRVGAMTRYRLSVQDVYVAVKWLQEQDARPLEMLAACSDDAPGLSAAGRAGLKRLAEDFDGLSQSDSPWDFLCTYLLDRTEIARDIANENSIASQMKGLALWQLLNFVRAPVYKGTGAPIRRVLDRVRELVLLAEDRQLREVPSNALHLDAVRLMTIHGSKGLEFEAVHLPALVQGTFPLGWQGERYPTPDGMIERLSDEPVTELAKSDQAAEEDCLFFVALSRAKTYARLYRYETYAKGGTVGASRYIGWLTEAGLTEVRARPIGAVTTSEPSPIAVKSEEAKSPTVAGLALYKDCPRRYFYTHVLQLGTARRQTAFTRTHNSIHKLITRWLNSENGSLTGDEMRAALDEIWESSGPTAHPAAAEYRALAEALAESLLQLSPADTTLKPIQAVLQLEMGTVSVEEGHIAQDADGRRVMRRVNTGRKHKEEYDHLAYALYQLAAEQHGASLEAVFLTTGEREAVTRMTDRVFRSRVKTVNEYLGSIRDGEFDAKPGIRCPDCPHFFVCDAVPPGELTIS